VDKEEGRLIRTQEMRKHKDEERMIGRKEDVYRNRKEERR
jgi:hypothetical protein